MLLFESANVANASYLTLTEHTIHLHRNVRSIRYFIDFISEVFKELLLEYYSDDLWVLFTPLTSFSGTPKKLSINHQLILVYSRYISIGLYVRQ